MEERDNSTNSSQRHKINSTENVGDPSYTAALVKYR